MASGWADEADKQARGMTRDLQEVGRSKGFRVTYQKREARFALRAGAATAYFQAHDYETSSGMDWLRLRIDVLTRARYGAAAGEREEAAGPAPLAGEEVGMAREVTDEDGITWSCAQAYAGLSSSPQVQEAARVEGADDLYRVVCTPSGGAQSVTLELPQGWEDSMSDEDLVRRIGKAQQAGG